MILIKKKNIYTAVETASRGDTDDKKDTEILKQTIELYNAFNKIHNLVKKTGMTDKGMTVNGMTDKGMIEKGLLEMGLLEKMLKTYCKNKNKEKD